MSVVQLKRGMKSTIKTIIEALNDSVSFMELFDDHKRQEQHDNALQVAYGLDSDELDDLTNLAQRLEDYKEETVYRLTKDDFDIVIDENYPHLTQSVRNELTNYAETNLEIEWTMYVDSFIENALYRYSGLETKNKKIRNALNELNATQPIPEHLFAKYQLECVGDVSETFYHIDSDEHLYRGWVFKGVLPDESGEGNDSFQVILNDVGNDHFTFTCEGNAESLQRVLGELKSNPNEEPKPFTHQTTDQD